MTTFNIFKLFFLLFLSFFFTACSHKTTIKTIKPATIYDKNIKKVAILKFENDDISLSSNIKSKMSSIYFDDKSFFTIVNRDDINTIMDEQKLQDSGLVDTKEDKVFSINEINSFISGKINSKNYHHSFYNEEREDTQICVQYVKDKKGNNSCVKYKKNIVLCNRYDYSIDAVVTISKISNSDILYSKNYFNSTSYSKCSDDYEIVPNRSSVYNILSNNIAQEFVSTISPSYIYIKVTLLDDADIEYTKEQEKLLENSLKLIELSHIIKANILLKKLVSSTQEKSYVALYNLAVTYESMGNLEQALSLYLKAQSISLTTDVVEEIFHALKRVKRSIDDRKKADIQIQN